MIESDMSMPPETAQRLKVIACAMAGGLSMAAGFAAFLHLRALGKVPTAQQVQLVNRLTTMNMIFAVAAIVVSEIIWRLLVKRASGPVAARVQGAFIVRLACREGAALVGIIAVYIGAVSGVLHAYPAYWVNMVPYALFIGFLTTHWPSAEKLAAETGEILS